MPSGVTPAGNRAPHATVSPVGTSSSFPPPPPYSISGCPSTVPRYVEYCGSEAPKTRDFFYGTKQPKSKGLPLHVKDVCCSINYDALLALEGTTHSRTNLQLALRWCTDDALYKEVFTRHCPFARTQGSCRASASDLSIMQKIGKIGDLPATPTKIQDCRNPWSIICGSNFFTVIEAAKMRRRPIMEPLLNDLLRKSDLLGIKLPTKQLIRSMFRKRFVVQFDASAFFDQFRLSDSVRPYFGIIFGGRSMAARCLPMGFRPSCDVAQSTAEHLISFDLGSCIAACYIDNFVFAGDTLTELQTAMKTFVARCKSAGVILNDYEPKIVDSECDCLGEHYNLKAQTRCLTQSAVEKLHLAGEVLVRQQTDLVPARTLAAVFGILFYANKVLNISPHRYYNALKFYRQLASSCSGDTPLSSWDQVAPRLPPSALQELQAWLLVALRNEPVPLSNDTDTNIDLILIVDASHWGVGALAITESGVRTFSQPWEQSDWVDANLRKSVTAEPLGVVKAACLAVSPSQHKRVHVISDHAPLVFAGNQGYGKGITYNSMVSKLEDLFGSSVRFTYSWTPGATNPADPLSRNQPYTEKGLNGILGFVSPRVVLPSVDKVAWWHTC